jgi:hypothetical protein
MRKVERVGPGVRSCVPSHTSNESEFEEALNTGFDCIGFCRLHLQL